MLFSFFPGHDRRRLHLGHHLPDWQLVQPALPLRLVGDGHGRHGRGSRRRHRIQAGLQPGLLLRRYKTVQDDTRRYKAIQDDTLAWTKIHDGTEEIKAVWTKLITGRFVIGPAFAGPTQNTGLTTGLNSIRLLWGKSFLQRKRVNKCQNCEPWQPLL